MLIHKLKKIATKFILAIIGIYFICQCGSCMSSQNEEIIRSHPVITSNIIPNYYESLFKPEIKNKLKLIISYEKKQKDTVSNFLYDRRFYIQIYTLSTMYKFSLAKSLKENFKKNEPEVGVNFYDNERSLINIWDRMVISKNDTPSDIFISFYGENPNVITKNDSVAAYFIDFKNLSIKFGVNGRQEVYAETSKLVHDTIPLEILMIKKNGRLYLLFMSPVKGIKLSPKTLYNLTVR